MAKKRERPQSPMERLGYKLAELHGDIISFNQDPNRTLSMMLVAMQDAIKEEIANQKALVDEVLRLGWDENRKTNDCSRQLLEYAEQLGIEVS